MDEEVKITVSTPLENKEAAQAEELPDNFNPSDMMPLLPGEKYPSMAEVLAGISSNNTSPSGGLQAGATKL